MKKELVIFEGNNIEMIMGKNNKPLFELYAVGMALGYTNKRKTLLEKNMFHHINQE